MANTVAESFEELKTRISPDKVKGMNAIYQWDVTGDGGGKWYVKLSDGAVDIQPGESDSPSITLTISSENYLDLVGGKLNGQMAFLTGKLKIQGDMTLAMKLQSLLG